MDSPRDICISPSRSTTGWPPSSKTPTSNEIRVRVEGLSEMTATHAQVNRPLRDEFAQAIAALEWDVGLLQEAPPSWLRQLAESARASGPSVLTSRNFASAVRGALARYNPDLIASNEGGSNQLLVRPPWRFGDVLRLTLTLRPERRAMLCALLHGPDGRDLLLANLHASAALPAGAARGGLAAAETAVDL